MPEIKWQVQLTYRVTSDTENTKAFVSELLHGLPVIGPDDLKLDTEFSVEHTLVDRFGPINVIQIFNSDVKAATNRAGLKTELVSIALADPGKLPPPEPKNYAPPRPIMKQIMKSYHRLWDLSLESSREDVRMGIEDLGELLKLVDQDDS
jgi:hypothetical protein